MGNENWGAIPRSLATGVSTMLNKKLGVSSGFKPVEWEDNINLLGKLPEKTVSGAVASFSDGADDVPIKSASFGIVASGGGGTPSTPVPIVGKSSVNVYQIGKNLIDTSSSAWEEGAINTSGQNATGANYIRTKGYFPIKALSQFIMSGTSLANGDQDGRFFSYDKNYEFIGYFNWRTSAVTPNSPDVAYFRMRFRNTVDISALQLEYGDTASTYEAYKSKTPITVALGQTVYGGSLAEDGTLTITHWCDIWDENQNYNVSDNLTNVFRFYKNYEKPTNAPTTVKCLCAIGNFSRTTWATDSVSFSSDSNNLTLKLSKSEVTDITEAKAWLAQNNVYFIYELATPIVVTGLDEISINTYLGDNSIWCDSGDSEIVYRSSGTKTIVPATLITKIITQNGTYSANSDNADGYSEVTVNTPVDTSIQMVYHNTTTGDTTFTATEAGKYLILVSYSDLGSGSITLPSGVTPDADFSKAHNRWGALIGKICDLSAGDTVTLNATSSSYGGIAYSKCVFRLKNISVTTVLASTDVEDSTLPSFAPTYTGNVLAIGASWGKNDAKCYDRTNPLGSGVEWASHVGLYTNLRITYGASIPAYVLYGYDGGALAIALQ